MRFSPDGHHLLGGVGAAGVFLDGAQKVVRAGGWGWLDAQTVIGPGDYDGPMPGLYRYPLPNGPQSYLNAILATNFYANAMGSWVRYLADGYTGSSDSAGNSWPDRIALGFEGIYQIFTDTSWVPLIFRDITTGGETRRDSPQEWEILPDGSTYFSRNFRGIYFGDVFWACGYQAAYGGLCIWRPFALNEPTYLLSTTPDDFNPDISKRPAGSDSYLLVGTGQNQGETAQHLYEIDLSLMQYRRDGGPWGPLTSQPAPQPPDPIVAIGRPIWQGWYLFEKSTGAPGNCSLLTGTSPAYVVAADGTRLCRYVAAAEDSNVDQLEAAIQQAKAEEPSMPVLAYWTYQAQQIRVPAGADYLGVEGYWKTVEPTIADLENRLRQNMARHPHPWIIAQCYTSNTQNHGDLRAVVPVYARVLRDLGDGCLSFSDGTRASGYADHPEVQPDWQQLAAGVTGVPPLPEPQPPEPEPQPPDPEPEPPEPEPEPPQPEPEPPQPEPPDPEPPEPQPIPPDPQPEPEPEEPAMTVGTKGQFRVLGASAGTAWVKGVVSTHQDESYLDGGPPIYAISTDFPGGEGDFCHFNEKGEYDGVRDSAGGEERVTFDGKNVMIARPSCSKDGNGTARVYEWVNL